jgi:hypothetical protein
MPQLLPGQNHVRAPTHMPPAPRAVVARLYLTCAEIRPPRNGLPQIYWFPPVSSPSKEGPGCSRWCVCSCVCLGAEILRIRCRRSSRPEEKPLRMRNLYEWSEALGLVHIREVVGSSPTATITTLSTNPAYAARSTRSPTTPPRCSCETRWTNLASRSALPWSRCNTSGEKWAGCRARGLPGENAQAEAICQRQTCAPVAGAFSRYRAQPHAGPTRA